MVRILLVLTDVGNKDKEVNVNKKTSQSGRFLFPIESGIAALLLLFEEHPDIVSGHH